MNIDLKKADWLTAMPLIAVFDAIEAAGGQVRVNGGAVRNALMGIGVSDIDLSTTLLPEQTIAALEAAGLKAIPTGLEHGTITAVSAKIPFEITTLREDIVTDGRHAIVRFGTNWIMDAQRRDLTINALYCDRDGSIFDPLGGMVDLEQRVIRFIGDAGERIEEDHLRILRFFRFFGWYGSGRPDANGLKACAKLKFGLEKISAERIWMELCKLLSAPDPSRALLWMRTTGVLNVILAESEKWGIDLIPHLISSEAKWRWKHDPLVRLCAMIRPDEENVVNLSRRLKLSNADSQKLVDWAMSSIPEAAISEADFAKRLYLGDVGGIIFRLKLEVSRLTSNNEGEGNNAKSYAQLIKFAQKWDRPVFPVKGQDLLDKGHQSGPGLGKTLKQLEKQWIESGFSMTRDALIASI